MSSAAIRSMICSLSCVGSSIAGSSHARRCTVGPAARGSCKETGESRSRARSNKEGPNGAAPSARLLNDLEDQGTTTSTGGRTPIFSPERAARQGDRRLLGSYLRLDNQHSVGQLGDSAGVVACQPKVATGGAVVRARQRQTVGLPHHVVERRAERSLQHSAVTQARQVGVALVVGPQVTNTDVPPFPRRPQRAVEIHPDVPRAVGGREQASLTQLRADPVG